MKVEDKVNLESALRLSDRLGGHIVTGHVDFVGKIKSIEPKWQSYIFEFEFPRDYQTHFVEKGSVAIDGTSLTIVQVQSNSFIVSVIPFTMSNTNLGERKVGDMVNIETDLFGKYAERILTAKKEQSKITKEWLKEKGW